MPAVDLADPLRHVIEEVAVVRDGEDGTLVILEEVLEPEHRLGIEVVGGLVQKQQVGGLEQQLAEGHAATLAAGKHRNRHIGVGQLQRVHRLAELGIDIPSVSRVNLILQAAHLCHERVKVRVGRGHLLADLVETLDLGEQVPKGHAHVLDHRLAVVERRLLLEQTYRVAGRKACLAVGDLLLARHDLEQG